MRWTLSLVALFALLPSTGCVTVVSATMLDLSPGVDVLPVPVEEVRARRQKGGVYELDVLYADGQVRSTEWTPGELTQWIEVDEAAPDLDAELELGRLDALAARGRWEQVVVDLDRLLLQSGERTFEVDGEQVLARDVARRRLLGLPAEGRRAYALLHDDPAARLLDAARVRPGTRELEQLLAEHPASASAASARRLLVERLVESGRAGSALEHLGLLLASVSGDERESLLRLRRQIRRLPRTREPSPWSRVKGDPGWPTSPRVRAEVARGATPWSGLHVANDQLQLFAGGRAVALLDMRRSAEREREGPRILTAQVVKASVGTLVLTATLALDLSSWPLQTVLGLIWLWRESAFDEEADES